MTKLYSVIDEKLQAVVIKYLPTPPSAKLFAGKPLPPIIAKTQKLSSRAIKKFLQLRGKTAETDVIKKQRNFRAEKRKKEDLVRVTERYKDEKMSPNEARTLLEEANKPYVPQCDEKSFPGLATRIMSAAEKVELFSTVKHHTSPNALESIFNDGLMGRQTLANFYLPFQPASLGKHDIWEGDANVVCLGANEIDPIAKHGIELEFNVEKLATDNPCVFYKQRDLGFDLHKMRSVRIADLELKFTHTGHFDPLPTGVTAFQTDTGQVSMVKNTLLVSYNLKKMHQILTLNFFRFIDGLYNKDSPGIKPKTKNTQVTNEIYTALSKLNEEELVTTLTAIGKQITDTMEFNFYGAYRIDFSALISIRNEDTKYCLHLPTLITQLATGNTDMLHEAQKKLPATAFKSYRFIDYLLSNTTNKAVVAELKTLRKACELPFWLSASKKNRGQV